MKKFLLLILLTTGYNCFSQDTPGAFATRINYIFEYIDKNEVGTGILQEYGIDFTNINNYGGTVLNDSNRVVIDEWRNIYASLYSAQINSNPGLSTLSAVNANIASYSSNSLAVLHYNFNAIRPDAVSSNLLSASGDQLFDVPNRPQNPYQEETAFAVCPARNWFPDYLDVALVFRQSTFYSNTGKSVSALYLDDGSGYEQAYWDTPFYLDLGSAGEHTVKAKVVYTDYSVYESHFVILTEDQTYNLRNFNALPDTAFTASRVYSGSPATGIVQIRISDQNNGKIMKPLIVAEGFDAGSILGIENINVNNFLDELIVDGYNLRDELDLAGYDIIYLDYDNGTDYIQNNAYLLQDVIKWVNDQKALNGSTEQNVVLGQSMGGLVARWAIKDMEDRSEVHDVRLNISMDSPHNGAYVPLSVQALLTGTYDFEIGLGLYGITFFKLFELSDYTKPLMDVFSSPAAKQMLIYQLDYDGSFIEDNGSYTGFMSAYHSKGLPANCQNIAISNGSSCADLQETSPGSYYANVNETSRLDYAQKLGVFYGSYLFGTVSKLKFLFSGVIGILPNKTTLSTQVKLRALGNQQDLEIYKAQIGVKRKILGFIDVNTYLINQSYYSGSRLPVDSSPGGTYDIGDFGLSALPSLFRSYIDQTSFCFVPTVSSLDLSTNFSNFSYSDLTFAYKSNNTGSYPKSTPFSAVKTAYKDNERHIEFTRANAEWFYSRLEDTSLPAPCVSYCTDNMEISGAPTICTSESYSIAGLPSGSSVTWTVSPSSIVGESLSGNSITLTNNANGIIELSATVNTPCGVFTLPVKQITSGVILTQFIDGPYDMCQYTAGHSFSIPDVAGATNYQWAIHPNPGDFSIIGNGSSSINVSNVAATGGYSLTVTITTNCGITGNEFGFAVNSCFARSSADNFVIYPNPAGSEITVFYKKQAFEDKKITDIRPGAINGISLINDRARVLRTVKSPHGTETLGMDVKDIPTGTYFLHIMQGREVIKRQVLIQH